ncbi:MAG: ABC transporter ATP-binding protein [Nanoarchaeota archaeon]|nr:ABC transporter ATP-binding protein [Nanoarchaeota archaeon]
MIRLDGISKSYNITRGQKRASIDVLRQINLLLKDGESLGIIGANGCGKSTLLRIIAGITVPTSGRMDIQGDVLTFLDTDSCFQDELSGTDNLVFYSTMLGWSREEMNSKLASVIRF